MTFTILQIILQYVHLTNDYFMLLSDISQVLYMYFESCIIQPNANESWIVIKEDDMNIHEMIIREFSYCVSVAGVTYCRL